MKNPSILPKSITLKCSATLLSPLHYELFDNATGGLFSVLLLESTVSFLKLFNYRWVVGSNGVWVLDQ